MSNPSTPPPARPRPKYRKAIGPRLKPVLLVVFALFGLLSINALYLLGVRILEAVTGQTYQNWFFMIMFLLHLVLGLMIVLPVIIASPVFAYRVFAGKATELEYS